MQNITVACVQTSLLWEDIKGNIQKFDLLLDAVKEDTDLIVLPEMFSTGFSMEPNRLSEKMNGISVSWMIHKAQSLGKAITGSLIIEEDGNYYNRLIWVFPDGKLDYYDKRHLFCLTNEQDYYTAGNKRTIIHYKGWRFNLNICYDLRFPVWTRYQEDYDCLIYVANWPEIRNQAWKALLKARAIENQAYVIASNRVGIDGNNYNYSGDSAIIHPDGNMIQEMANEETILYAELNAQEQQTFRSKLPFLLNADPFKIIE